MTRLMLSKDQKQREDKNEYIPTREIQSRASIHFPRRLESLSKPIFHFITTLNDSREV